MGIIDITSRQEREILSTRHCHADLDILSVAEGMPDLHLPKGDVTPQALELARHLREQLMRPRQSAAA
jgi:hypothetical protein